MTTSSRLRIARPFADAVDRAFDLTRAGLDSRQRIGRRHAEIVVAVGRQRDVFAAGDMVQDAREQRPVFFRRHIAGRIRDIDDGRAGFDDGFNDAVQILRVGPSAVFGEILHVRAAQGAGVFDGADADFQRFLPALFEFVFQVAFADAEARYGCVAGPRL